AAAGARVGEREVPRLVHGDGADGPVDAALPPDHALLVEGPAPGTGLAELEPPEGGVIGAVHVRGERPHQGLVVAEVAVVEGDVKGLPGERCVFVTCRAR